MHGGGGGGGGDYGGGTWWWWWWWLVVVMVVVVVQSLYTYVVCLPCRAQILILSSSFLLFDNFMITSSLLASHKLLAMCMYIDTLERKQVHTRVHMLCVLKNSGTMHII